MTPTTTSSGSRSRTACLRRPTASRCSRVMATSKCSPEVVHLFRYDILDRLIEKNEDAAGSTPSELVTRYRYDANENRTLEIKPEGNRNSVVYDERDLLFSRTRGDGSSEASTFRYSYDANRNLVEQCDAADTDGSPGNNCSILGGGDATRNVYDGFDRRVRSIDAVGGEVRTNYDPNS